MLIVLHCNVDVTSYALLFDPLFRGTPHVTSRSLFTIVCELQSLFWFMTLIHDWRSFIDDLCLLNSYNLHIMDLIHPNGNWCEYSTSSSLKSRFISIIFSNPDVAFRRLCFHVGFSVLLLHPCLTVSFTVNFWSTNVSYKFYLGYTVHLNLVIMTKSYKKIF